jgi:RNA polymerase sigma factor (TIGR02999 family)
LADLLVAPDVDAAVAGFISSFIQACAKKPPKRTSRLKDFTALPADAVAVCLQRAKIMAGKSSEDVTALLLNWQSGNDENAPAELMPLVYEELRRVARAYLQREREDHTLQATALVHEAYLQLVDDKKVTWKDRAHFYGIAARLMRQILIQHARAHDAAKRGGSGQIRLSIDEASDLSTDCAVELVALDDALEGFTKIYPRKSKVVELKFFGGMEAKQISEVLQVSEKTVLRDWTFARLWLSRELRKDAA